MTSTHSDPLAWWQSQFGSIAPVGHALRRQLTSHWARFHSLPESKRYPETELDFAELLNRHSRVAAELFSVGERLFVFHSLVQESPSRRRARRSIAGRQLRDAELQLPTNADGSSEAEDLVATRALVTTWKPDFFDRLVMDVANEEERLVAIASPASRNIFCPYDGGMDIFTFSVPCSGLEEKYSTWLSTRADKL